MLDYKDIITKNRVLHMSGSEIARQLGCSKSGVNDFLRAFGKCEKISFPLPEGITNEKICELVYGHLPGITSGRDESFKLPDFEFVSQQMKDRDNMTLVYQWNRYSRICEAEGKKPYQYRQFCELYGRWCEDNYETMHFNAVAGQTMEVDFAGRTFKLTSRITGDEIDIVVFVAVLPYSQYIYAEGMTSTKEPQWIAVNNNALQFFGGVPSIVVCDNCKQAVIVNKDWIEPELNRDYAEWAEHNHTVILPAKVRKPKYKSSVECSVGILEKGIFHDLEDLKFFSLEDFNQRLWELLDAVNSSPFKKKEHDRFFFWKEEKSELMPLPSMQYQYMERSKAKVNHDFHVCFDHCYYSVDKEHKGKHVIIRASALKVFIHDMGGTLIREWPRGVHKGQWFTDPSLNGDKDKSAWNATYFIQKAMTVGPNTVEVIKRVLTSRILEVQTYRLCVGILGFSHKYGKDVLEECCSRALEVNRTTYSYIKNTIQAVAADSTQSISRINEERNRGAYIMSREVSEVDNLLSRSQKLLKASGKEVSDEQIW